jgi:hypothetical protein
LALIAGCFGKVRRFWWVKGCLSKSSYPPLEFIEFLAFLVVILSVRPFVRRLLHVGEMHSYLAAK